MSAARRQIGAILLESGRISAEDVEHVLEYQQQHGGFFGQALVTLGIVSRDELDWALANQLDIPYIFPNAAAVDREAAALVTPKWALANLAVPIVRAGNALTVVAAEPLDDPVVEQLRTATGLDVEMALASATRVRELIHDIYGDTGTAAPVTLSLTEVLAEAIDAGAVAFGVSARRTYAIGWYRSESTARYRLHDAWTTLLNDALAPPPKERMQPGAHGTYEWDAELRVGGQEFGVHVRALVGDGGVEYLLAPAQPLEPRTNVRDIVLPDAIATELRILYRSGHARIAVVTNDDALTHSLVPQLPRLFGGPDLRSVHLADQVSGTTYSIRIDDDPALPEVIRLFHFDVITIDTARSEEMLQHLMSAAPFCFVAMSQTQLGMLAERGFSWILTVSHTPAGTLGWELLPVGG